MRVLLHKLGNQLHALEIVRDSGERERVECETRSVLVHDFIHFAVEQEARLTEGFWGKLASGTTLAEMNDRARPAAPDDAMTEIERLVGALSMAAKGTPPAEVVEKMKSYSAALELGVPEWLTDTFVGKVQERLRRLRGEWDATPYGGTMELVWNGGELKARGPRESARGSP